MKNLNEIVNDLVVHVFNKHGVSADTIKVDDFDLDRVHINNDEYVLRMWNIYENGTVEYTLYKTINNSGLFIGRGKERVSKSFVRLLQARVEQEYLEYTQTQHNKD